jgi:hypothetical protein
MSQHGAIHHVTPSIADVIYNAPWQDLEAHLSDLRERVDDSISAAQDLRRRYREELLERDPGLQARVQRPSQAALDAARELMLRGTIVAADGTVSPVPLASGAKIQVGVALAANVGTVVSLVTRVFEHELLNDSRTATEFFAELRLARKDSYLLSHAIMLFGERKLLMDAAADWRMIHGELVPHELRTGAGQPAANLPPTFDLIYRYIASQQFLAATESSGDLDLMNAAEILAPSEYIVIRSLTDKLLLFLEGNEDTGKQQAKFAQADERRFRQFIERAGPEVAEVLVKAGHRPFVIECHADRVEEAVALFMVDSLWVRGLPLDGSGSAVRGFPFHIDLADSAARTLFSGSEFRTFVETRLMDISVEQGLFDLDPRRTR